MIIITKEIIKEAQKQYKELINKQENMSEQEFIDLVKSTNKKEYKRVKVAEDRFMNMYNIFINNLSYYSLSSKLKEDYEKINTEVFGKYLAYAAFSKEKNFDQKDLLNFKNQFQYENLGNLNEYHNSITSGKIVGNPIFKDVKDFYAQVQFDHPSDGTLTQEAKDYIQLVSQERQQARKQKIKEKQDEEKRIQDEKILQKRQYRTNHASSVQDGVHSLDGTVKNLEEDTKENVQISEEELLTSTEIAEKLAKENEATIRQNQENLLKKEQDKLRKWEMERETEKYDKQAKEDEESFENLSPYYTKKELKEKNSREEQAFQRDIKKLVAKEKKKQYLENGGDLLKDIGNVTYKRRDHLKQLQRLEEIKKRKEAGKITYEQSQKKIDELEKAQKRREEIARKRLEKKYQRYLHNQQVKEVREFIKNVGINEMTNEQIQEMQDQIQREYDEKLQRKESHKIALASQLPTILQYKKVKDNQESKYLDYKDQYMKDHQVEHTDRIGYVFDEIKKIDSSSDAQVQLTSKKQKEELYVGNYSQIKHNYDKRTIGDFFKHPIDFITALHQKNKAERFLKDCGYSKDDMLVMKNPEAVYEQLTGKTIKSNILHDKRQKSKEANLNKGQQKSKELAKEKVVVIESEIQVQNSIEEIVKEEDKKELVIEQEQLNASMN